MRRSAQAAVTGHLGWGLKQQHLLSPSSGGWVRESLPSWLIDGTFFLVFTWCFLCACGDRGKSPLALPLVIRTPALSDCGPTLMTSFKLNYLLRSHISKYSHVGGLGVNLQIWGDTVQPMKEPSGEVRACDANLGFFWTQLTLPNDPPPV